MGLLDYVRSVLYWAFAPYRKLKRALAWLGSDQHPLPPPIYEPRNILGDGVFHALEAAVFMLTENNCHTGTPLGVGFCVGGKNKAITAFHNLPQGARVGTRVVGFLGQLNIGKWLQMRVTFIDQQLDFATLEIYHSNFTYNSLRLHPKDPTPGIEVVVVAYQISREQQAHPTNTYSISVMPGALIKVHARHLVYNCPTFAGNSEGALIFKDGAVIGMHTETVNEAVERLARASVTDRLDDVERSVDSMIRGLHSGSIGLKSAQFAHLVQ